MHARTHARTHNRPPIQPTYHANTHIHIIHTRAHVRTHKNTPTHPSDISIKTLPIEVYNLFTDHQPKVRIIKHHSMTSVAHARLLFGFNQ